MERNPPAPAPLAVVWTLDASTVAVEQPDVELQPSKGESRDPLGRAARCGYLPNGGRCCAASRKAAA